MNKSNSLIEGIVKDNPEKYERLLLAYLNTDSLFYGTLFPVLCRSPKGKIVINHFSVPAHYSLYKAITYWKTILDEAGLDFNTPLTESTLRDILNELSKDISSGVTDTDFDEIISAFNEVNQYSLNDIVPIVGSTWKEWLRERNAKVWGKKLSKSSSSEVIEEYKDSDNNISSAGMDDLSSEFYFDIDDNQEVIERINLGSTFSHLSYCLGGGLGRKEHIIFCAPTGGGKTVMACQIAGTLAKLNNSTKESKRSYILYITTEQPPSELIPRIVSCCATKDDITVPFDLIKDGGDVRSKLNSSQIQAISELNESLRPYLFFEDWGSGVNVGASVTGMIEGTIQKYLKKTNGKLNVVILDWLGAALGDGIEDTGLLRLRYIKAAECMYRVAKKYNLACISFVQTSVDAVKNRKARIGPEDLAECKTVHYQATAAFGISALTPPKAKGDAEKEDNTSSASYLDDQVINCFKSRKAKGMWWGVKREFQFQRFAENGRSSGKSG